MRISTLIGLLEEARNNNPLGGNADVKFAIRERRTLLGTHEVEGLLAGEIMFDIDVARLGIRNDVAELITDPANVVWVKVD